MAAALVAAIAALGGFWAPAMALLSEASEHAGLDQALAFGVANLAWALGHMLGSAAERHWPTSRPTLSPTRCWA